MDYTSLLNKIFSKLEMIEAYVESIYYSLDENLYIMIQQFDHIVAVLLLFFFTWLGFTLIRPKIFKI